MQALLEAFIADEDGATAIEYGLIAALVAVIAIVGMTSVGGGLQGLYNSVASRATTVWNNASSG